MPVRGSGTFLGALMATFDCTVVIPTVSRRWEMLSRAVGSVALQTLAPLRVTVELDSDRAGAAATRDRALPTVATEWVAFLDDDDEMLPQHLDRLHSTAMETGADLVYPWFTVVGGTDPFPQLFDRPYADGYTQTTVTFLARTELVVAAGGFSGDHTLGNEENALVRRMYSRGASVVHLPERTWLWHHHGANTSGRSDR